MNPSADLVERDDSLAIIAAALDAAATANGRLLLLEGEPGIGKTRLLRALADQAQAHGMLVLRGRGSELEREFPFGVLRQALDPIFEAADASALDRMFSGAASPARGLLFDEERASRPLIPDAAYASLRALYWLLVGFTRDRPLALVFDDLHWADAPSLRFVLFLATRLDELPITLALASRPGEAGPNQALVDELRERAREVTLRPRPLSTTAVATLIERRLASTPEPAFVDACHEASGGNPLLLGELLNELVSENGAPVASYVQRVRSLGPPAIARSVVLRIGRLSAEAVELVRALAVLGDGGSLAVAVRLAAMDPETAPAAVDALVRAHVLTPDGDGFTHPLLRSAIYEDQPLGSRMARHRRAAQLLLRSGAPAEQIAAQALAAGPELPEALLSAVRLAAAEALKRGAPDVAARYLRRIAYSSGTGPARAEIIAALGRAELDAGDPVAAATHLAAARKGTGDPLARADLAVWQGRATLMAGRLGDAVALLDDAIDELDGRDAELNLRLQAEVIGAARFFPATRHIVRERLDRLRPEIRGGGPEERRLLAHLTWELLMDAVSSEEVGRTATLALGQGALLAEEGTGSTVYFMPIWALIYSDRVDAAERELDLAAVQVRETGSEIGFALTAAARAEAALRSGSLENAEAFSRLVLERDEKVVLEQPLALGAALGAMLGRGDTEGALGLLGAEGLSAPLPRLPLFLPVYFARGQLKLALGQVQAGVADLYLTGEIARELGSRTTVFPWRSLAAVTLHAAGEHDRAEQLAREDLALAERARIPRARGYALHALGVIAGDEPAREALLREAVAALEESADRLELARSLVALGACLRRQGARLRSREPLRRGLELAGDCGALPLIEQARAELSATGEWIRPATRPGGSLLTPSELRIAEMAADGASNNEIAQTLFVSVKTVEMHLSSSYRKLDIDRRGHLRAALNTMQVQRTGVTAGVRSERSQG